MRNECRIVESRYSNEKTILVEITPSWAERIIYATKDMEVTNTNSELITLTLGLRDALSRIDEQKAT